MDEIQTKLNRQFLGQVNEADIAPACKEFAVKENSTVQMRDSYQGKRDKYLKCDKRCKEKSSQAGDW